MNLGDVNVRVIERDSRFTALGIRFWDPVLDAPVRDGLRVILQPGRIRGTPTEGVITPSGAYAFHGIPGLTDYEFGRDEPASPEQVQNYVVHVVDTRGRYVETAFAIELPMADPRALLGQPVSSPAAEFVPGVLLYSGPARRTPAWLGTVRGTLRQLATGEAAAHALVRVTDTDGQRWPAIADAGGQFTALMSYPAPATTTLGSPPRIRVSPLPSQTWDVSVEVFHAPELQRLRVGLPDYRDILTQPQVGVAQTLESPVVPVTAWSGTLQYGVDLVPRSGGESELWIGEPESP